MFVFKLHLLRRYIMGLWGMVFFCSAIPAQSADAETTRIVSLVPNLTELTFALGAGEQVVGVSDFCHYPPEASTRPAVGGLINPSLEGVLKLRPSVVLLYRSQTDFANRLKILGVSAELLPVDTLADLRKAIDTLGVITGKTTTSAALLSTIDRKLDQVRTESSATTSTKGIIIVSRDPSGLKSLYQAPRSGFLGELFEIAGGTLAIPDGAPVSREAIIRANPDLIIDLTSSSDTTETLSQEVGQWGQLSTVNAVKNGRVYRWSNPRASLLGPSVLDTVLVLRKIITSD